MNTKLTWLHISDLHVRGKTKWDADRVLKSLVDDVRSLVASGLKPDLILCTGDVAFGGTEADYEAAEPFFTMLLAACGLDRERLFTIPGNHDVDRSKFGLAANSIIEKLRDAPAGAGELSPAQKQARIASLFEDSREHAARAIVFEPVAGYTAFAPPSCKPLSDRPFWVRRQPIPSFSRGFVLIGLHSAWTCSGDDGKNLLLGRWQVERALAQVKEDDVVLAMVHHPLDWLAEWDEREVRSLLMHRVHFVLRGHLHQSAQTVTPGGAIEIAAGSAYDGSQYPNGYSFGRVDLDDGTLTLTLRRWVPERGGFWTEEPLPPHAGEKGRMILDLPRPLTTQARNHAGRPGAPLPSSASTSIERDATTLLIVLLLEETVPNDSQRGRYSLDGYEVAKRTKWDSNRVHDAAFLLEAEGLVDLEKGESITLFGFESIDLTARGRSEAERRRRLTSKAPEADHRASPQPASSAVSTRGGGREQQTKQNATAIQGRLLKGLLALLLIFILVASHDCWTRQFGWFSEEMPPGVHRSNRERVYVWKELNDAQAIAIEMVYVPPGDFEMGSEKRREHMSEGYYIARNDVTWEQFRAFCRAKRVPEPTKPAFDVGEDHPVVNVSAVDAEAFCEWTGLQLPTERQWERAARGTDGRPYPWGYDRSPAAGLCVWKDDPRYGNKSTAPVGSCPDGASPVGALDMVGNVWQWARVGDGKNYMIRGGGWKTATVYVTCNDRIDKGPSERSDEIGFRPVKTLGPQTTRNAPKETHEIRSNPLATRFAVRDLGILSNQANGANSKDQVVGAGGWFWSELSRDSLVPLRRADGATAEATAINDAGAIVGMVHGARSDGVRGDFAVIWIASNAEPRELNSLGSVSSRAVGINNSGQIIGELTPSNGDHARAVTWSDLHAEPRKLKMPLNVYCVPTALNGRGQIIGMQTIAGVQTGLFWASSESEGVPVRGLVEDAPTKLMGMNGEGQIVGCSFKDGSHPWLPVYWEQASANPTLLRCHLDVPYTGEARSINAKGEIVGILDGEAGRPAAAYWDSANSTAVLLPSLEGGENSIAVFITDQSLIVGYSDKGPGSPVHAVAWQPR